MKKLMWKFFPPPEVTAVKSAIEKYLSESTALGAPNILVNTALDVTQDVEAIVETVKSENISPERIALFAVINAIADLIPTGQFHTYRGVLGMTGTDMLEIWNKAQQDAVDFGYLTVEKRKEECSWLTQQIKSVG